MALEGRIKPVNKDHSIKEAVLSLFLASPIIKPERFQQLIEAKFKGTFQQFESLLQVQVQFKNEVGKPPNFSQEVFNNAGFKFNAFEKGLPVRILQGLNDVGNNRTYISYHSLNYSRWVNFFEAYMDAISIINEFSADLFVTALSLQYVDEFLLLDNEIATQNLIFNPNANFIPKEFFNATINQYSILIEKQNNQKKYLDRLEIKVDRLIRPAINILHNISQYLPDTTALKSLLTGNELARDFEYAHLENKKVLRDILTDEAIKMINL